MPPRKRGASAAASRGRSGKATLRKNASVDPTSVRKSGRKAKTVKSAALVDSEAEEVSETEALEEARDEPESFEEVTGESTSDVERSEPEELALADVISMSDDGEWEAVPEVERTPKKSRSISSGNIRSAPETPQTPSPSKKKTPATSRATTRTPGKRVKVETQSDDDGRDANPSPQKRGRVQQRSPSVELLDSPPKTIAKAKGVARNGARGRSTDVTKALSRASVPSDGARASVKVTAVKDKHEDMSTDTKTGVATTPRKLAATLSKSTRAGSPEENKSSPAKTKAAASTPSRRRDISSASPSKKGREVKTENEDSVLVSPARKATSTKKSNKAPDSAESFFSRRPDDEDKAAKQSKLFTPRSKKFNTATIRNAIDNIVDNEDNSDVPMDVDGDAYHSDFSAADLGATVEDDTDDELPVRKIKKAPSASPLLGPSSPARAVSPEPLALADERPLSPVNDGTEFAIGPSADIINPTADDPFAEYYDDALKRGYQHSPPLQVVHVSYSGSGKIRAILWSKGIINNPKYACLFSAMYEALIRRTDGKYVHNTARADPNQFTLHIFPGASRSKVVCIPTSQGPQRAILQTLAVITRQCSIRHPTTFSNNSTKLVKQAFFLPIQGDLERTMAFIGNVLNLPRLQVYVGGNPPSLIARTIPGEPDDNEDQGELFGLASTGHGDDDGTPSGPAISFKKMRERTTWSHKDDIPVWDCRRHFRKHRLHEDGPFDYKNLFTYPRLNGELQLGDIVLMLYCAATYPSTQSGSAGNAENLSLNLYGAILIARYT